MNTSFYIDNRFFIEPTVNSVTDLTTGQVTRLEARLMQLLCILTEQAPKMTSREELVSKIWQDYGGGDEGLTQAISFLRKALLDHDKKLIQTVPKKGYIFTGMISFAAGESKSGEKRPSSFLRKKRVFGVGVIVLMLIGWLIYQNIDAKGTTNKPVEIAFPVDTAAEELLEENDTNTIITRSAGDTLYKLVSIGDRPPRFYINSKRISEGDWEHYMPLIQSLKRKLAERRND